MSESCPELLKVTNVRVTKSSAKKQDYRQLDQQTDQMKDRHIHIERCEDASKMIGSKWSVQGSTASAVIQANAQMA